MENYLGDAFLTGVTPNGRYGTSAFQSAPEDSRKEDKTGLAKIDDDIAALEGKIAKHLRGIDMHCYATERALQNLALDGDSLQVDLPYPHIVCREMSQRMCGSQHGKANYLRLLVQLLGKLNSLAKEIKKINRFKAANQNKRHAQTSQQYRRQGSPFRSALRTPQNESQHPTKKKCPEEELVNRYESALKEEMEYRLTHSAFQENDKRVFENVRQYNLKKVKKVKLLNKKADEVYHQQKEKEAKLYDHLIEKQRSLLLETPVGSTGPVGPSETQFKHLGVRQLVQYRKHMLEEQLHERLSRILEKHQSKIVPSHSTGKDSDDIDRKIHEVRERKQQLEANMFRLKLRKLIEKEERIKLIAEAPKHLRQSSTATDLSRGADDTLTKPVSLKTTYVAREHPDRSVLLQTLTASQALVSFRRDTLLKQLSSDIHHRLEERTQLQTRKLEENQTASRAKLSELQGRLISSKQKIRSAAAKSQREKENAIREKFRLAATRYRCEDKIIRFRQLPAGEVERRLKLGRQAALQDLNL